MIGYKLCVLGGVPWRRVHGALIPHLPPHLQPPMDRARAGEMLRRTRSLLVRWERDFDCGRPTEWWHLIKDSDPGMDALAKKVRYLVRQGGRRFSVGPCDSSVILAEGHEVYRRAYERYETFEKRLEEPEFKAAVASMPAGTEFWCARARADGRMVAFAENVVRDDACFYSTMWFSPDALSESVGYVLIQAMNEHYLGERRFRYVSDGARNLSHQTGIHDFLQSKFGFRRAYSKLEVVYWKPLALAVGMAYPFRLILGKAPGLRRLKVLLEQERIRQACRDNVRA